MSGGWIAAAFVVLWSTGFVGGRWGLPHADPFALLAIRLACAATILAGMAAFTGVRWPRSGPSLGIIVLAGLLTHGAYLGGVFSAIAAGAPTGLVALIVGLQPLLTAVGGPLAGQPAMARRQWGGLVLGLCGVALVVPRGNGVAAASLSQFAPCVVALLGITAGSLIQKRWVPPTDFRVLAATQYIATAALFALLATAFDGWRVDWTPAFVGSLVWLTGALSVGAVALLYRLIRDRSMEQVTSLFYLTPGVTALMGLVLFDEQLMLRQWLGFPLVGVAVWLSTRRSGTPT